MFHRLSLPDTARTHPLATKGMAENAYGVQRNPHPLRPPGVSLSGATRECPDVDIEGRPDKFSDATWHF